MRHILVAVCVLLLSIPLHAQDTDPNIEPQAQPALTDNQSGSNAPVSSPDTDSEPSSSEPPQTANTSSDKTHSADNDTAKLTPNDTKDHAAHPDLQLSLKLVDLWIAIPPALATVLVAFLTGFFQRKATRSDGQQDDGSPLAKSIGLGLSVVVGLSAFIFLFARFVVPSRTTIDSVPPEVIRTALASISTENEQATVSRIELLRESLTDLNATTSELEAQVRQLSSSAKEGSNALPTQQQLLKALVETREMSARIDQGFRDHEPRLASIESHQIGFLLIMNIVAYGLVLAVCLPAFVLFRRVRRSESDLEHFNRELKELRKELRPNREQY